MGHFKLYVCVDLVYILHFKYCHKKELHWISIEWGARKSWLTTSWKDTSSRLTWKKESDMVGCMIQFQIFTEIFLFCQLPGKRLQYLPNLFVKINCFCIKHRSNHLYQTQSAPKPNCILWREMLCKNVYFLCSSVCCCVCSCVQIKQRLIWRKCQLGIKLAMVD